MKSQKQLLLYLNNIRKGVATNSSSVHSVIYRKKSDKIWKDLAVFDLDYYDRYDTVIAVSREAKIKYILANIFRNEELVKLLEYKYPEFKQYYPLIKKEMDSSDYDSNTYFGAYPRGAMYPYNNLPASLEIIENIIEDENCIIVAGSDEEDDYYGIIDGYDTMPSFSYVEFLIKNGNYYILNRGIDGKIRLCVEKQQNPIPMYPELIDINITNHCEHNCSFCYRGCTTEGKHADLSYLYKIIYNLSIPTELVLGGGNVLDHSGLDDIISYAYEKGHQVSLTINVSDYTRLLKLPCVSYLKGIGISVFSEQDLDKVFEIVKALPDSHVAFHVIPEYLGYDKTFKLLSAINRKCSEVEEYYSANVVLLGYKTTGRGKDNAIILSKKDLASLFDFRNILISTDTCFNNKYLKYMKDHFDDRSITFNEGEYSMYIDAVSQCVYRSSYQLDKSYRLEKNDIYKASISEIFSKIRKDNGFEVYKQKHYWDSKD